MGYLGEVTWAEGMGQDRVLDCGGELLCVRLQPVGEVSQCLLEDTPSTMRTSFVPERDSSHPWEGLLWGAWQLPDISALGFCSAESSLACCLEGDGLQDHPEPRLLLEMMSLLPQGFHREQVEPTLAPREGSGRYLLRLDAASR